MQIASYFNKKKSHISLKSHWLLDMYMELVRCLTKNATAKKHNIFAFFMVEAFPCKNIFAKCAAHFLPISFIANFMASKEINRILLKHVYIPLLNTRR